MCKIAVDNRSVAWYTEHILKIVGRYWGMAKKKVGTSKIVMAVAALLGVVTFFLLLAPGVSWKYVLASKTVDDGAISCFKLMFGGTLFKVASYEAKLGFNFVAFLAFLFLLVGLVGVVLSFLLKGKLGGILAVAGFLLAGIFLFLCKAVLPMSIEDASSVVKDGGDFLDALEKVGFDFSLGAGAIVGGILSILAALASAAATFACKK